MNLSPQFRKWLDARSVTLPACSCHLYLPGNSTTSPPHEPDCERFIYAEHYFFEFERERTEQLRAVYREHERDALSSARGIINGLMMSAVIFAIAALVYWAITSALAP